MASPRATPGPGGDALPELEPLQALWRGIITGLVLVMPAAILNNLLIDDGTIEPGHPATFVFWLLILLGGAAGGWATIRLAPSAQLAHAAAAGAGAYLVAQGVGVGDGVELDEPGERAVGQGGSTALDAHGRVGVHDRGTHTAGAGVDDEDAHSGPPGQVTVSRRPSARGRSAGATCGRTCPRASRRSPSGSP